jgi:hypothetical protein
VISCRFQTSGLLLVEDAFREEVESGRVVDIHDKMPRTIFEQDRIRSLLQGVADKARRGVLLDQRIMPKVGVTFQDTSIEISFWWEVI